ncbi:PEP/pyruvate-binding domain-containing protein [Frigoribacterium salinisoli]
MPHDPLDASGRVFSRDPVLGTDEVVVTARWGEAVPHGLASGPPDVVVVDAGGSVLHRETHEKRTAHVLDLETDLLVEHDVNVFRRRAEVLDDEAVRRLARAAREAERTAGGPVQADWTLRAGALELHDARLLPLGEG